MDPIAQPGSTQHSDESHPRVGGWWFAIIVFGILGGLIGYFAVRSDEPRRANLIMKWTLIVQAALLVFWTAVVAVLFLVVLSDDAPEEVGISTASSQLDLDLAEGTVSLDNDNQQLDADQESGAANSGAAFDGDINGVWIVDDEIGDFDFETASGSFAGFRVDEELTVGEVVAVGRSGGVTGSLTIDGDALSAAEIVVDMNTIKSNDGRRESAIRRAVGASSNPTATFVLTEAVSLPAGLADGEAVSVDAVGELTINGVTNAATFAIDALVRDDGFGVVVGSTQMVWEDYGVTPPSAAIVVSVADDGIVEFQLIVAKG